MIELNIPLEIPFAMLPMRKILPSLPREAGTTESIRAVSLDLTPVCSEDIGVCKKDT
jgi:hypothetical protein